jgi:hypothetical protein
MIDLAQQAACQAGKVQCQWRIYAAEPFKGLIYQAFSITADTPMPAFQSACRRNMGNL